MLLLCIGFTKTHLAAVLLTVPRSEKVVLKGCSYSNMKAYFPLIVITLAFLEVTFSSSTQETTETNVRLLISPSKNENDTKRQAMYETIGLLTDDAHGISHRAPKSVVLVLGKVDIGLSVTRFLTEETNSHKNRSNDVSRDTKIRNGSESSHSILSNIIIDSSQDLTFCILVTPDENNIFQEVATASFNNDLAEHVEKLKILFVLNYSAVIEGNHQELINLLKQANNVIKSPTKFRQAMSLIIANVESEDSAETIVEGIANFLKSVRSERKNNFEGEAEDQKRAEEILNALLFKNGQQVHPKISYMSYAKPTETSEDQRDETSLLKQRLHSQKFVSTSPNDFLLTLSKNGTILAGNIAPVIIEMIHEKIIAMSEEIIRYMQDHKALNIFITFGNVIKNYKSLQAFNQKVQKSSSTQTFLQELYELNASMKIPQFLENVTWIQNREKNLKFIEQVTGKTFPTNAETLSAPILQAIPTVENITKEMASALDLQITLSFENLASQLQNKLAEQIKNESSETSKQQLLSLSESLLNVIETSNKAETYNQVTSEVQNFLQNSRLIEDASTIIQSLADDINLKETGCLFSNPFKLWKWLRYFKVLRQFIEQEKTTLEIKGLSKTHKDKLNQLTLASTDIEANLTEAFNNEVLMQSTLNARRNQEKEKLEIQLQNFVSSCNQNLTAIKTVHQLQYIANKAKKLQDEKLLEDKKVQEGINTQRIQTNCTNSEYQLITKLANERQQNSARLEEERGRRTRQNNELKQKYTNEIKEQERLCRSEITKKENTCTQQRNAATKMSVDEKINWERTVELKRGTCNQELNKMEVQCNQQKDNLRKEAEGMKQELRNFLRQKETECNAGQAAVIRTCNGKITSVVTSAKQELEIMKAKNNENRMRCLSNHYAKLSEHETRKDNIVEEYKREVVEPMVENCNRRKEEAGSEVRDEFQRKKRAFIRRWERSDRCCYSNGGWCRDGTRGTPCCSYSSCTYQFLKSNCCKCGSECRK